MGAAAPVRGGAPRRPARARTRRAPRSPRAVTAAAGGDAASGGNSHVERIRATAVRPARQWRAHRRVGRAGAEPEARPKLDCVGARFRQLGRHRSRAHGQGHGRRTGRSRSCATNRSGADATAARARAVSGADDKRARYARTRVLDGAGRGPSPRRRGAFASTRPGTHFSTRSGTGAGAVTTPRCRP